jgi:SAM-dependent methyltransferase
LGTAVCKTSAIEDRDLLSALVLRFSVGTRRTAVSHSLEVAAKEILTSSPQAWPLSWIARSHHALVFGRRTRVLAGAAASLIGESASVLDVGCGDGTIAALLNEKRPDLSIEGVEIAPRPSCRIACRAFDGSHLPFPDRSFGVCLLLDVLHHTADVTQLLREAVRVARDSVLVKDHLSENSLDNGTLRFMDWIGNRPHGVALPYNYQSRRQWESHFAACGLRVEQFFCGMPLYPVPFSLLFGRKLHFVAKLRKA